MTKKNNTKKETKKEAIFDLETALKELECPEMFKAGLKSYITRNNKEIKNDKDFNKIVKEFAGVKL